MDLLSAPAKALKVPMGHSLQANAFVAPETGLNVPDGHNEQELEPIAWANVPGLHNVHAVAPDRE